MSAMSHYTNEDLEHAKAELAEWQRRFDDYTGNNPNKHQASIRAARRKVREIEAALKESGIIPMADDEKLASTLDRLFPNARSREIVELDGQKYQRRFVPLEKSRSGKSVTAWAKYWVNASENDR
jgi:hypothetical protein